MEVNGLFCWAYWLNSDDEDEDIHYMLMDSWLHLMLLVDLVDLVDRDGELYPPRWHVECVKYLQDTTNYMCLNPVCWHPKSSGEICDVKIWGRECQKRCFAWKMFQLPNPFGRCGCMWWGGSNYCTCVIACNGLPLFNGIMMEHEAYWIPFFNMWFLMFCGESVMFEVSNSRRSSSRMEWWSQRFEERPARCIRGKLQIRTLLSYTRHDCRVLQYSLWTRFANACLGRFRTPLTVWSGRQDEIGERSTLRRRDSDVWSVGTEPLQSGDEY